jgi:uncharacterized membrane protein YheB (UPF0754 family)
MLPLLALRARGAVATGNAPASKDELAALEQSIADAVLMQKEILKLAKKQLTEDELKRVLDAAVEKTVKEATTPADNKTQQTQEDKKNAAVLAGSEILKSNLKVQKALANRRDSVQDTNDESDESDESGFESEARAGPTWPVWGA